MPIVIKYTRKEIEARNHRDDAAIIIDNVVYDVTEFMEDHPGGTEVLMDNAGKDASECFLEVRHSDIAIDWRKDFAIGEVVDEDKWEIKTREPTPPLEPDPLLHRLLLASGTPVMLVMLALIIYTYLFK